MKRGSLILSLLIIAILFISSCYPQMGSKINSGCTNQDAENYNGDATIDDGSCDYDNCGWESIGMCEDMSGASYECDGYCGSVEEVVDSFCYGDEIELEQGAGTIGCCCLTVYGCTNPDADNYNEDAEIEDGSCIGEGGCTVVGACNYNPDAVIEDGSCTFSEQGYNCDGECTGAANAYCGCPIYEHQLEDGEINIYSSTWDGQACGVGSPCHIHYCNYWCIENPEGCTDDGSMWGTPDFIIYNDVSCQHLGGDMNGDISVNVLDVVALVGCVLGQNCSACTGDINGDGGHNVLDIVALVNGILF